MNITALAYARGVVSIFALSATLAAQTNTAALPDSATFDSDGTSHITRVVPMPVTVSSEVFEGLPHAFWYHFQLPETAEALGLMAKFFEQKLGR